MNALLADVNVNWYLPPLVIAVSLVYSATRFENWTLIWTHAVRWAVYILSFLGGAYLILYLISLDLHPAWYLAMIGAAVVFFGSGKLKGRKSKGA